MKKLHYSTRRCALCDAVIADEFIVCKEHMEDYRKFGNDEWFKMCVETQRRQFEIDNEENFIKDGIYKVIKPYRKLSESEKYAIRYLKNRGLGARNISKLLGIHERTIGSYLYSLSKSKQKIA